MIADYIPAICIVVIHPNAQCKTFSTLVFSLPSCIISESWKTKSNACKSCLSFLHKSLRNFNVVTKHQIGINAHPKKIYFIWMRWRATHEEPFVLFSIDMQFCLNARRHRVQWIFIDGEYGSHVENLTRKIITNKNTSIGKSVYFVANFSTTIKESFYFYKVHSSIVVELCC